MIFRMCKYMLKRKTSFILIRKCILKRISSGSVSDHQTWWTASREMCILFIVLRFIFLHLFNLCSEDFVAQLPLTMTLLCCVLLVNWVHCFILCSGSVSFSPLILEQFALIVSSAAFWVSCGGSSFWIDLIEIAV